MHTFNPSSWEAEANSVSLRLVWSTKREFQDSQGCYIEKPCLKKQKQKKLTLLRLGPLCNCSST